MAFKCLGMGGMNSKRSASRHICIKIRRRDHWKDYGGFHLADLSPSPEVLVNIYFIFMSGDLATEHMNPA